MMPKEPARNPRIAERTIAATQIIRLSVEDQRNVGETMLNPPKPNAALQRAAAAYRRLIKSGARPNNAPPEAQSPRQADIPRQLIAFMKARIP